MHYTNRPEWAEFLKRIIERPDDDLPRLVLCDWLEELGDDEAAGRAEFIRVQVAVARNRFLSGATGSDAPMLTSREMVEGGRLRKRERELWAALEPWDFARPFARPDWTLTAFATGTAFRVGAREGHPDDVRCDVRCEVRRGFPDAVSTTLAGWCGWQCSCGVGLEGIWNCRRCNGVGRLLGIGPAVVRSHPVERVILTDREPAHLYNRGTGERWCTWLRDGESLPVLSWQDGDTHSDWEVRCRVPVAVWFKSLAGQFATADEAKTALSAALILWAKSQPAPHPNVPAGSEP